jgi:prophage regulatory protein
VPNPTGFHQAGLEMTNRRQLVGSAGLPENGFVRLKAILAPTGPIPVSKSTWWGGVKIGRFPKPIKIGPAITAWRVEDIRELVRKLGNGAEG